VPGRNQEATSERRKSEHSCQRQAAAVRHLSGRRRADQTGQKKGRERPSVELESVKFHRSRRQHRRNGKRLECNHRDAHEDPDAEHASARRKNPSII
jgi:hypothetical protein